MASDTLKQHIKDALVRLYFHDEDDAVYVMDTDEPGDSVHVVIVSPKFRGKRLAEKTDLILSQLTQELPPEEWGRVTLSVGVAPEEIKAL
jgi:stress-induced morphogen